MVIASLVCCFGVTCRILGQLVRVPLTNFKNARGLLAKHVSDSHMTCLLQAAEFTKRYISQQSVDVLQASGDLVQVQNYRSSLKSIVKTILFLGRQGLALRGHDEKHEFKAPGYHKGKRALKETKHSSSSSSGLSMVSSARSSDENKVRKNHGNFSHLLDLRVDAGDSVLGKHLQEAPLTARYTSPDIQNQILALLYTMILAALLAPLRAAQACGSVLGYFAIQADEASDAANKEQLTLVLRFLSDGLIREYFVGWITCTKTNGLNLYRRIKRYVRDTLQLDLAFLRGQGYDGAGAMIGPEKGLAARFLAKYPLAWFFHCAGHMLNLTIAAGAKSILLVRNMIDTVNAVFLFFYNSPKRTAFLNSHEGLCLKGLCKIRWAERTPALARFEHKLPVVIEVIQAIADDDAWAGGDTSDVESASDSEPDSDDEKKERDHWNYESRKDASGLVGSINNFQFIIVLITTLRCWAVTSGLCVALQGPAKDIVAGYAMVDTVVAQLKDMRRDIVSVFSPWFETATVLAAKLDLLPGVPRRVGRQRNRENYQGGPEEYYRRAVAIPLLDSMIAQLEDKFSEQKAVIRGAIPAVLVACDDEVEWKESILEFAAFHKDALPRFHEIDAELGLWWKKWKAANLDGKQVPVDAQGTFSATNASINGNIFVLVVLLCIFPVTTCTCERSVSTLRRVKTFLRTSTGENRLSALSVLSVHRDVPLDLTEVVDKFARERLRRANFFHRDLVTSVDMY